MKEGVSIIFCCYNSVSRIHSTLEHLSRQKVNECPAWEIIVVNNNSTDDTEGAVRKCIDEFHLDNLTLVNEVRPGLMNARMTGGKNASFGILSFIDDDNWVENAWVEKVYRIFRKHPEVSILGGSSTAHLETNPPEWFGHFSFAYAVGKQQEKSGIVPASRGFIWGAGLSVRMDCWMSAEKDQQTFFLTGRKGNFLSAGEDSELCLYWQLKGKKIWYEEDLRFIHSIASNRLSDSYLTRLFSGFGSSEVILRIYRMVLQSSELSFTHELRYAAKNAALNLFKKLVLNPFTTDAVKKMDRSTRFHYYRSYRDTLINIRAEYQSMIRTIQGHKIN
jgi:glycosyltransferase involved in cell wall biosynthesis